MRFHTAAILFLMSSLIEAPSFASLSTEEPDAALEEAGPKATPVPTPEDNLISALSDPKAKVDEKAVAAILEKKTLAEQRDFLKTVFKLQQDNKGSTQFDRLVALMPQGNLRKLVSQDVNGALTEELRRRLDGRVTDVEGATQKIAGAVISQGERIGQLNQRVNNAEQNIRQVQDQQNKQQQNQQQQQQAAAPAEEQVAQAGAAGTGMTTPTEESKDKEKGGEPGAVPTVTSTAGTNLLQKTSDGDKEAQKLVVPTYASVASVKFEDVPKGINQLDIIGGIFKPTGARGGALVSLNGQSVASKTSGAAGSMKAFAPDRLLSSVSGNGQAVLPPGYGVGLAAGSTKNSRFIVDTHLKGVVATSGQSSYEKAYGADVREAAIASSQQNGGTPKVLETVTTTAGGHKGAK